MNSEIDDAWILYRLSRQNYVIIGVFDSREAASACVKKNGSVDQAGWVEPRPGQRYWQYETDKFTYFLERHQIRQAPGTVQDASEPVSSIYG